jgi:hypothetical protein
VAKQKMPYQKSGSDKMAKMKAEAKKEAEPVDEEVAENAGGKDTDDAAPATPAAPAVAMMAITPHHIESLHAAHARSGHKMHPEDAATLQNHIHMMRGACAKRY